MYLRVVITTSTTKPDIHVSFGTLSIVSLLYLMNYIYENQIKTHNFYCYRFCIQLCSYIYGFPNIRVTPGKPDLKFQQCLQPNLHDKIYIYFFFYLYDVQLKLQPLCLEILSIVALRLCRTTYISVHTNITKHDSDSPSIYSTLYNHISTE